MDLKRIGGLVFKTRMAMSMTQAELADAAHVSRRLVNMLENGKLDDIGYVRLAAIADVLGLEIDLHGRSRIPDAWL